VTEIAWHRLARSELLEASDHYDEKSQGLGEAFLDSVQSALNQLEEHPRLGRVIFRQIRRHLVSRFPYSVIYRLDRGTDPEQIYILAVAHDKRQPRYWASRR
jgi:toxin ParE1/3/4